MMKITKTQLKQIIREEREKLLNEMNSRHPKGVGSQHNAAELGGAFEALHSAIDSLINLIGREETLSELEGMVDNWQEESYPEQVQQEPPPPTMPDDYDDGAWYTYQMDHPFD